MHILLTRPLEDSKSLIIKLQDIMSQSNKYPVKIKAGINYHAMTDMTSRIS